MIKINLLGAPKPKRGKRAVTTMTDMGPSGGGGGGSPLLFMVLGLLIGAGVVWYGYNSETKRGESIKSQMTSAELENRRLATVKAKYDQEERVKENYQRRVNVIDELRANQNGPVNLLTMIGDTINNTDAVWLNSMQDSGPSITLDGTALSAGAVANLIKNLQKTGYFKSVEISETAQDTSSKDIAVFNFKLTCEKQKS